MARTGYPPTSAALAAWIVAWTLGASSCQERLPPASFEGPGLRDAWPGSSRVAVARADDAGVAFVPERVWGEGSAMGTRVGIAAYTTPSVDVAAARRAFDAAIAELRRVEALMTTWQDSEITRVNAAAGEAGVAVSQETFDLVKESVHASEISEGAFDITFESLHGLWKFDQDLDPHPPSAQAVRDKLPLLNFKHIELDGEKRTIRLAKKGVKIGLGGIAKGYGVDRAVLVLQKAGLTSFFVQAGGDLFARGQKPDGTEWSAGIRDPRGKAPFALMPLRDHAFSTAGDYERSYVVGGRRYHHIIDPRTGYPATACRSVTIWAPTALVADEIDDAVFILGPEKGMQLVDDLPGVGAIIVDARNNLWVSRRLEGKLRIIAPPTEGL